MTDDIAALIKETRQSADACEFTTRSKLLHRLADVISHLPTPSSPEEIAKLIARADRWLAPGVAPTYSDAILLLMDLRKALHSLAQENKKLKGGDVDGVTGKQSRSEDQQEDGKPGADMLAQTGFCS